VDQAHKNTESYEVPEFDHSYADNYIDKVHDYNDAQDDYKLDNLNEDDLGKIRANRIAAMKKEAEQKKENVSNGHGTLTQITDQKEFFDAAKKSNKMVVVFTRNSNEHGKMLLDHMKRIATDHLEARFLWLEADNAPFLTDRFNIFMLPTIVCIENNKVKCQHNGLNDLDGSGKYSTGMLEYLLNAADGMLDDAPIYERELREAEDDDFSDDD